MTPSIHRATRSLAASVRISFIIQVVNVKFNMLCLYVSTSFRLCLFMYFMQYVEALYQIYQNQLPRLALSSEPTLTRSFMFAFMCGCFCCLLVLSKPLFIVKYCHANGILLYVTL